MLSSSAMVQLWNNRTISHGSLATSSSSLPTAADGTAFNQWYSPARRKAFKRRAETCASPSQVSTDSLLSVQYHFVCILKTNSFHASQIQACGNEPDPLCYMACGKLAKELIVVAALLDEDKELNAEAVLNHALHKCLIVQTEPQLICHSDLAKGTRIPDYAVVFQAPVSPCSKVHAARVSDVNVIMTPSCLLHSKQSYLDLCFCLCFSQYTKRYNKFLCRGPSWLSSAIRTLFKLGKFLFVV